MPDGRELDSLGRRTRGSGARENEEKSRYWTSSQVLVGAGRERRQEGGGAGRREQEARGRKKSSGEKNVMFFTETHKGGSWAALRCTSARWKARSRRGGKEEKSCAL